MNNSEILKQIIESRKSTYPKDYTGEEISQEILDEILSSAQFAPNHKKTKPWKFRVFRGEEKQQLAKEIQKIYKRTTPGDLFLEKKYLDFADKIAKTDTVVTISVNFSGLLPEWEEIAATSMAVQNMYLTFPFFLWLNMSSVGYSLTGMAFSAFSQTLSAVPSSCRFATSI